MRLMGNTIMVLLKCFCTVEEAGRTMTYKSMMDTGVLGKIVAWDCVTEGTGIAGIEK